MNRTADNLKTRPRYQEVRNTLANEIATGVYAPHSLLPGSHALAQRFDVSIDTIGRAVKQLAAEGMVRCRRGSLPRVLPFRERKSNLKIAILVNAQNDDNAVNYSYDTGSWCWMLHQELMLKLLNDLNPSISLAWRSNWEKQLEGLDGAIALEANWNNFHLPDAMSAQNFPFVRIQPSAMEPELAENNTLYIDSAESDRRMAAYFLANGMKRFLVYNFDHFPISDGRNRHHTFWDALLSAGVPEEQIITVPRTPSTGGAWENYADEFAKTTEEVLEKSTEPVSFLVNEYQAKQLVRRALALGKRFKKDCSIVALSNRPQPCEESGITISVLRHSMDKIAETGLNMLYSMIRTHGASTPNRAMSNQLEIFET